MCICPLLKSLTARLAGLGASPCRCPWPQPLFSTSNHSRGIEVARKSLLRYPVLKSEARWGEVWPPTARAAGVGGSGSH